MIAKMIVALLLSLLPLRSCVSDGCAWLEAGIAALDAEVLPFPPADPRWRFRDAAVLAGDSVIAVLEDPALPNTNRRKLQSNADPIGEASLKFQVGGEGLVMVDADRWWYATAGQTDDGVYGAQLFEGGSQGEVSSRFVPLPFDGPSLWVTLPGAVPAGLHLSFRADEFQALEVDSRGVRRSWRGLPAPMHVALSARRRAAARLPDGRIAMISLERGGQGWRRVLLHVLGDEGRISERVLADRHEFSGVAMAAHPDGKVAVAVSLRFSNDETAGIQATIIDVDDFAEPSWRTLSKSQRVTAPKVVSTSRGFIAAWSEAGGSEPMRLRAVELDPKRSRAAIVDIGVVAGSDLWSVHASSGEPVFLWLDGDPQKLMVRRPAMPLDEFAAVEALVEWCTGRTSAVPVP